VLMGLRYDPALIKQLLKGVRTMKESATYQAILEEGRAEGEAKGKAEGAAEEAQRILLRIGTRTLGEPDAAAQAAIAALADRDRLEALIDRVPDVKTWEELLAKPRSGRKPKR